VNRLQCANLERVVVGARTVLRRWAGVYYSRPLNVKRAMSDNQEIKRERLDAYVDLMDKLDRIEKDPSNKELLKQGRKARKRFATARNACEKNLSPDEEKQLKSVILKIEDERRTEPLLKRRP
jgi:hypothetical protein